VAAGAITHALRFTVQRTQRAYLWPARHQASSNSDPNLPPMGLRLRMKASVDISRFSPGNQVILRALKQYGMLVSDNGSNWFISGAPDDRWDNNDLNALKAIPGSDFEVVDESALQVSADSGAARGAAAQTPTATPASSTPPPIAATPTLRASTAGSKSVAGNTGSSSGSLSWLAPVLLVGSGGGVIALASFLFRRRWRRGHSP
jgi:hypothetical protein